ncbi:MAG: CPBP family intramembrane metalloprotease [Chloroflexia bacterium]|nr:CPBP family intramembrane metalloprotease [Chloroflexia bacterium]
MSDESVSKRDWPPRLWDWKSGLAILLLFLALYFGGSFWIGRHPELFPAGDGERQLVLLAGLLDIAASGGSVLLIGLLFKRHRLREIGFRRTGRQWLLIAVALFIVLIILRAILVAILWVMFPALREGLEPLEALRLRGAPLPQALLIILVVGFLAPLAEELFWRGFLHNWLRNRLGPWLAIVLSSLAFGLFHIIPLQIVAAVLMGFALAWIYEESGSLWPAILLHACNNLAALLITLLVPLPTM